MINNKRKLSEDCIDSEQTKKSHIDDKISEITIEDVCKRAKLLNDESLTKEPTVVIICDDGEILRTKAYVLLWSRTLFTLYPPLDTNIRFEMPIRDNNLKCSYAFVTMVDALRLRVDMTMCAKINDDYSLIHLKHKEKVDKDTDPEDWLDNYSKMMKIKK
ncbi:MAG: hypothetical protein Terrestrivirus1_226 [Terrestrivirus sp.]|uniref:Uncharacterized protein n=1 Tax=Terrestrivirus sp. TaxID=2487775 RepID=A0A3G4ZKI6_9VIRU|nr:MAG: hypothetical protein Terrestrivirus1_226 [Terrestrivirus sp.]